MFLEVRLFLQAVGTVANALCVVGLSLAVVFALGYPQTLASSLELFFSGMKAPSVFQNIHICSLKHHKR